MWRLCALIGFVDYGIQLLSESARLKKNVDLSDEGEHCEPIKKNQFFEYTL